MAMRLSPWTTSKSSLPEPAAYSRSIRLPVDDALQISHQHQMRRGFVIRHAAHHHLAVLTPEVEEVQQELARGELAVRVQPARPDAFVVDRVGRRQILAGQLATDEPQVQHILHVGIRAFVLATHQHRLDHPPHPVLAQLVGQLIQVRVVTQDQRLAGFAQLVLVDQHRTVAIRPDFPDGLLGQRIDQLGLALRRGPCQLDRFGCEALTLGGGVLGVQRFQLRSGEVAEPDALGLDVEGRAGNGRPAAMGWHEDPARFITA
jgi:hypothetical protein